MNIRWEGDHIIYLAGIVAVTVIMVTMVLSAPDDKAVSRTMVNYENAVPDVSLKCIGGYRMVIADGHMYQLLENTPDGPRLAMCPKD